MDDTEDSISFADPITIALPHFVNDVPIKDVPRDLIEKLALYLDPLNSPVIKNWTALADCLGLTAVQIEVSIACDSMLLHKLICFCSLSVYAKPHRISEESNRGIIDEKRVWEC